MNEFDERPIDNEGIAQDEPAAERTETLLTRIEPGEPAAPAAEAPEPAPSAGPFYSEEIRNEATKRHSSRFKSIAALVCAACLIGGTSLGVGIGIGVPLANNYILPRLLDDSEQIKNFTFPESQAQPVGAFSGQYGLTTFADIVAKVKPSTVTITSQIKGEQVFFNFRAPYEGIGAGTGILYGETDVNYLIATNAHVVNGAEAVQVSIDGHDGINAKLVGKNVNADLAVISVSKADAQKAGVTSVSFATFGNSDLMQVGDIVIAIGNSLGEGNTATNGIISTGEKEITVDDLKLTVFQTNAAINQGNSGGPLVNLNGEVIGINTAKISQTTGASIEGTGYAIPSNVIVPILQELMQQTGRPIMGISGETLSAELAQQYNLPQAGVIVRYVEEEFPAAKAGLQVNDIITGIDDEPVMTFEQLLEIMTKHKAGDRIDVKVIRNGREFLTKSITLVANEQQGF